VTDFTGLGFETFTVADVSSKGVEAELNARLSDQVTLNAGITYADAEYGDDCDDGGTIPAATELCGLDLTQAPKISSTFGVTYDGELGDSGWGLTGNVNLATRSGRRTDIFPRQFDEQPGVTKINARIGFSMPNDLASIEFWGLNLSDQIEINRTFGTPFVGDARSAFVESPRQYGVTIRTNF